ncbi:hypothetical protein ACSAZK_12235 [Methanosarcina sp. Mfa9]|uniref:hypothetical protein n=1 Tax=Methanosarcina sp. Mfa9 TaxID=3439063 RepID=UPI003F8269F4
MCYIVKYSDTVHTFFQMEKLKIFNFAGGKSPSSAPEETGRGSSPADKIGKY